MVGAAKEIFPVNLEDEMRQSYLDYAMSVIVGRALPDVRDGLKPVHRRVLYAMRELGNDYNRPYKKSARVVGDVIGKYHPHGDAAVYDTIVRLAQNFSMRYVLIDGQGNFGSIDGDAPAAMRYTEVRMARIAQELLADIDKDTVDFAANYDESEHEPTVLPTRIPNLLVNGSSGIAVGMATNIPPHNLGEVVDACLAIIDNPDLTLAELIELMPGPDFPTAGQIHGVQGIVSAYSTGRGRIYVRAKTHIEEIDKRGREAIVITELPYQVNKARLIEKIADLVREKRLEGITELRDESDKDGMRVVIELRRGELADVVLNNLYKQTPLQSVFGINMVGLVDGQPRVLPLRELLNVYLRHRREVVTRRTLFDLRKARTRAHVLEGLMVALANIDEVIALIRRSSSPAEAKTALCERRWTPGAVVPMLERAGAVATRLDDLPDDLGLSDDGYRLSSVQAQAILDLRLHRLTGLEQNKISNEYNELLDKITEHQDILSDPDKLQEVIRTELSEVRERYADARRTEIVEDYSDLRIEDLIPDQSLVVTLSHSGYAKAQPATDYQAQRRGGRGRAATRMKDEDFIDQLFVANAHDTLLCFSTRGKVYWLKVYQLPQAGYTSRGRPIVNLLPLEKDERISTVLPIGDYEEDRYVFFATRNGRVKKTPLAAFSRPRSKGIIALELRRKDRLIGAGITDGRQDIMLFARSGKAIRFSEGDVRHMGRTAAGVRGLRLSGPGDEVIALNIIGDGLILMATENGYGKLTPLDEFPVQGRSGQGVIAIRTSERNGPMIGAMQVAPDDEVMLITSAGTLVRTPVSDISVVGRNTQGVKLIRLDEEDRLVGIDRVEALQEEEAGES
ncbi:DNA gyrase subunit A [Candidatus Rariloculus sp.]|uniref:DNA gyrase subunit A n=1 Tax=Candidatus Rariloculus sp. TaxID=3101265 RepID=UPI003D13711F